MNKYAEIKILIERIIDDMEKVKELYEDFSIIDTYNELKFVVQEDIDNCIKLLNQVAGLE